MASVCSDCGGETVGFAVPDALRAYAPDEAPAAAICSVCLATEPADPDSDSNSNSDPNSDPDSDAPADLSSVASYLPDGDAGAAVALLLGKLDSLALNRAAIEALAAAAERAGADVLLTLDRVAADDGVDPRFDAERRRRQVEQLLG